MELPDIEDLVSNYQSASPKYEPIQNITTIQKKLINWYDENQRKLPWRGNMPEFNPSGRFPNAYGTWVSEIMLQQTRVETVIPYWIKWMEKFPDIVTLANSTPEEVNKYWAGLEYYRRAQLLLKGAKKVVSDFNGQLPTSTKALLSIPGIGPYTAGAISSIAFQQVEPLVDGNVHRVLSRLQAIRFEIGSPKMEKLSWSLARSLVDLERPGDFNQALMELGAVVCKPTSPLCNSCPIHSHCHAKALVDFTISQSKNNLTNEQSLLTSSMSSRHSTPNTAKKSYDMKQNENNKQLNKIEYAIIDLVNESDEIFEKSQPSSTSTSTQTNSPPTLIPASPSTLFSDDLPTDISVFPFKIPKKKPKNISLSVAIVFTLSPRLLKSSFSQPSSSKTSPSSSTPLISSNPKSEINFDQFSFTSTSDPQNKILSSSSSSTSSSSSNSPTNSFSSFPTLSSQPSSPPPIIPPQGSFSPSSFPNSYLSLLELLSLSSVNLEEDLLFLFVRRPPSGLLAHQWEFPNIEILSPTPLPTPGKKGGSRRKRVQIIQNEDGDEDNNNNNNNNNNDDDDDDGNDDDLENYEESNDEIKEVTSIEVNFQEVDESKKNGKKGKGKEKVEKIGKIKNNQSNNLLTIGVKDSKGEGESERKKRKAGRITHALKPSPSSLKKICPTPPSSPSPLPDSEVYFDSHSQVLRLLNELTKIEWKLMSNNLGGLESKTTEYVLERKKKEITIKFEGLRSSKSEPLAQKLFNDQLLIKQGQRIGNKVHTLGNPLQKSLQIVTIDDEDDENHSEVGCVGGIEASSIDELNQFENKLINETILSSQGHQNQNEEVIPGNVREELFNSPVALITPFQIDSDNSSLHLNNSLNPIVHIFSHQIHTYHPSLYLLGSTPSSSISSSFTLLSHPTKSHREIQWLNFQQIQEKGITSGCKKILEQVLKEIQKVIH